jgi:hypothetical protein
MRANFKRYVDQISQNVIALLNIWKIWTRIKVIGQRKSKNRVALSNRVRCVWTLKVSTTPPNDNIQKTTNRNGLLSRKQNFPSRKRSCFALYLCRRRKVGKIRIMNQLHFFTFCKKNKNLDCDIQLRRVQITIVLEICISKYLKLFNHYLDM